ncbi:hypothetical protein GDO78_018086 [Eleutherodactylus coqui]|uniref:Uncharacterized protein n=1 Tax=Eleutherodactylus coqui TaxID=57060 RepID=A0A8J6ECM8_ELECQ|nr:hypothetical protein GDO78_018086 [Eleutherodactylus coqui]
MPIPDSVIQISQCAGGLKRYILFLLFCSAFCISICKPQLGVAPKHGRCANVSTMLFFFYDAFHIGLEASLSTSFLYGRVCFPLFHGEPAETALYFIPSNTPFLSSYSAIIWWVY